MESKPWWASMTMIANLVAMVGTILVGLGVTGFTLDDQALVIAFLGAAVNMALRYFKTSQPIA